MARHVVHAERLPGGGVRLWLDGQLLKDVQCWGLIEELREPSRLSLTMLVSEIVWGAPPAAAPVRPPFDDDGLEHYCLALPGSRRTPSGKNACETCGEAWMCSTATHRLDATAGLDAPSDAPLGSGHGQQGND